MQLKAQIRDTKAEAKALRRQSLIPAVMYGRGQDPINLSLDKKETVAVLRKARRTDIFEVAFEDKTFRCIIKEVQKHPVTSEVYHVDFYKFDPSKHINIEVPIVLKGDAKGVKAGGDLYQPRKKITLNSLPDSIPNEIALDVSNLDIGDSIHAFDLELPEGVKIASSRNFEIVGVVGKSKEEQTAAEQESQAESAVSK
ncbi:LSU ribosomal protein L25p [Desulfurella amilsii]|uniref:Large ribosomal subunit protein bL25 n=1 Tax=Desulfurella amilsii TaxID=1562698 RepID=A0A1X4XXZ6_9BACT|nr:50S ribosomal protein L25 [Desulfurella amilsii]OSS42410.1 LSU ribosomal protein L25p [Desulfurella amilsii]